MRLTELPSLLSLTAVVYAIPLPDTAENTGIEARNAQARVITAELPHVRVNMVSHELATTPGCPLRQGCPALVNRHLPQYEPQQPYGYSTQPQYAYSAYTSSASYAYPPYSIQFTYQSSHIYPPPQAYPCPLRSGCVPPPNQAPHPPQTDQVPNPNQAPRPPQTDQVPNPNQAPRPPQTDQVPNPNQAPEPPWVSPPQRDQLEPGIEESAEKYMRERYRRLYMNERGREPNEAEWQKLMGDWKQQSKAAKRAAANLQHLVEKRIVASAPPLETE